MIKLKIITPEGLYKQLTTPIINVTSLDGERGILPNHMPVVFMLDIGRLETEEAGQRKEYALAGGMFYFENNEAQMLVNAIEAKEDIDLNRAEASKDRQIQKLQSKDAQYDLKRAEIALKKAMNRIRVANL